jgi:GNAT superfamily N-acetyltransferase
LLATNDESPEITRLDAASARPEFKCGDNDIDEFFHKDSIVGAAELMCVTYAWRQRGQTLAFFSVSNDAVKREECPRSAFERITKLIPRQKRHSSMPAVKIGRLGVVADAQRSKYGSKILDYLKVWFTQNNKTGCRFLLVDAYNKPHTLAFYERNGFKFLTGKDEKEDTRIMYFDLIPFANSSQIADSCEDSEGGEAKEA